MRYTLTLLHFTFTGGKEAEFDEVGIKRINEHFENFKISLTASNTLEAHAKARKHFSEVFNLECKNMINNIESYNFILKVVQIEEL